MLVSGVTGLVGRRVAAALADRGDAVVGLSRSAARARGEVPALADAIRWDGAGAPLPDEAIEGFDAIVHLAGEPVSGRWTAKKKARIEKSRTEGTRYLVDAIERAAVRPRVLVSASAMGYYGERGEDVVTEDEPAADDFLARICVEWEAQARRAEGLGVRVVLLRIGLVLATEGGALEQMLPIFKAGLGGPIGGGRQWWSWIHVDDVVGIVERALSDEAMRGPYNVVAPEPIWQRDFATALGSVLGRPTFVPTPGFALKAAFGGFADEVLGSRRLVASRLMEQGFHHAHPTLDGALRDLLG